MENFHNHSSTGTGDWKMEHVILTSYISWLSHGWWKKWNFTWNDNNTLTVKYITIKSFEIQTFRYFFPLIKGQGYQYSMSVLGQDVLNMWTTFLVNIFALTHHWPRNTVLRSNFCSASFSRSVPRTKMVLFFSENYI